MSDEPLTVAILVYPETTGAVVYGMYDLFCSAGQDWELITEGRPGSRRIRPLLVSRRGESLSISNGINVSPDTSLANCPPVPFIVVPEVNLPPGTSLSPMFAEEIQWLKERYVAGAVLAAGCSGAMLFAEAGLLDGQPATTHWAWCDALRERFPRVQVHGRRTLVVSGDQQRLVMAGGGASFLDLTLYLIARMLDVKTAMQVARINLIDWHHVGQQPFARLARTRQVDDAIIARCQTWIAEHYEQTAPVRSMVRLSGLAERTFKRRFRNATGMSPLEYVHTLRLEEAKQMLEAGDEPVEAIARAVGYEDPGYFARLFKRNVSLTPAQYRKRFGALRRTLQASEISPRPRAASGTRA
jgi:transcriptional regulator GlxA family with amidase domain